VADPGDRESLLRAEAEKAWEGESPIIYDALHGVSARPDFDSYLVGYLAHAERAEKQDGRLRALYEAADKAAHAYGKSNSRLSRDEHDAMEILAQVLTRFDDAGEQELPGGAIDRLQARAIPLDAGEPSAQRPDED
jgi:hypothetical protein